ncbi:MAG: hypothetical protein ACE5MK_03990 [Acidobacteriota bacterium]
MGCYQGEKITVPCSGTLQRYQCMAVKTITIDLEDGRLVRLLTETVGAGELVARKESLCFSV